MKLLLVFFFKIKLLALNIFVYTVAFILDFDVPIVIIDMS